MLFKLYQNFVHLKDIVGLYCKNFITIPNSVEILWNLKLRNVFSIVCFYGNNNQEPVIHVRLLICFKFM